MKKVIKKKRTAVLHHLDDARVKKLHDVLLAIPALATRSAAINWCIDQAHAEPSDNK